MGFVRLHALSQEEASERLSTLQHSHHVKQEEMLNIVRKRETEQQWKQAEELAKQQAAEQERQKQEEYNRLVLQATQAKDSEQWDEAIANLEKAATLYPEKTEVAQLKTECQNAKSIAEYRQQEQRAAEQKFCQPLAEVIKGKISAGNLVGTTVKWLKTEEHTFGQSEHDAFIAEARQLPIKEQKNLKSKLSALAKIVGKDVTDELLSELENN
jgi:hypothetical protein